MKKISVLLLSLLIISSVDSIRNLPAAAIFGAPLIFFFVFGAIFFLIPVALVSAELSSTFPEKGGVYHWVASAFGERWGMLAIWLQWVNTVVWFPVGLSFIAATLAYPIDPLLTQNKLFLTLVMLAMFWLMTFVNLFSLKISTVVSSICGTFGTILPLTFIIALGFYWWGSDRPANLDLSLSSIVPTLGSQSWISLTAIMSSFLGMELAGVHVNDIRDPQKNFPKAILLAVIFITLSMLLGSLTIAYVLPAKQINLVAGVMQVFSDFFNRFHLPGLTLWLSIAIVIGSLGGFINWLISPVKGLLHASEFGFLPPFWMRKNKHGIAKNLLVAQAACVSLITLVFLFVPTVNSFYWFLMGLSTELYLLMYLLLFACAIKHRYTQPRQKQSFKIPGRPLFLWIACGMGSIGCLITLTVSFFPPPEIAIRSNATYATMIALGNLITLSPLVLFFRYKKK